MTLKHYVRVAAVAVVLLGAAIGRLSSQANQQNIPTASTLPANCLTGGLFLKTGTSAGLYICLSTDTWTGPLSTGGGSPGGAATTVQVNDGSGGFAGHDGFTFTDVGGDLDIYLGDPTFVDPVIEVYSYAGWNGLYVQQTNTSAFVDLAATDTNGVYFTLRQDDGILDAFVSPAGDPVVQFTGDGRLSPTNDASSTVALQAYDDDDATYRVFGTLANGNTPSFTLQAPSGGTLALGTPTSITLTNATGLPLGSGVTGDLPLANLTPASAASRILGRGSASGAGDYQEIAIGSGLTMTGTTLSATGGGSGTAVGRFGVFFDGGGSSITTGTSKPFRLPSVAGTITRVTLYANTACDASIDLWLAAYSASAYPTNSDSVTGGNDPALTADLSMQDGTLTSWTTSFSGGETGLVNIDSTSGCGYLVVSFDYEYSV